MILTLNLEVLVTGDSYERLYHNAQRRVDEALAELLPYKVGDSVETKDGEWAKIVEIKGPYDILLSIDGIADEYYTYTEIKE